MVHEKPIFKGELPKRGACTVWRSKGGGGEGWQKRGGGVFEEGLMPSMHTMLLPAIILTTFGKNQHGKPDMLVKIK